jgi:phosphatidate cytidylyltransferase
MNQVLQRSLTGIVFLAVVIGSIMYSAWTALLLFAGFTVLAHAEFLRLSGAVKIHAAALLPALSLYALLVLEAMGVFSSALLPAATLVPILLLAGGITPNRKKVEYASALSSLVYVVLPFSLAIWLALLPGYYDPYLLLAFFILLWSNDTGAYVWGRLIGGPKLWPAISPGKTWSGCFGGILTSVLAGYLIAVFLVDDPVHSIWLGLGAVIGILSTLGDLFESVLKRRAGVKDSGKILPGHGGVLDRFDGMIFALPGAYAYLAYLKFGF